MLLSRNGKHMGIGVIVIFIFMLTLDLVTYRESAGTMEVSEKQHQMNTFLLDGCKLALIGSRRNNTVQIPSSAGSKRLEQAVF